MLNAFLSMWNVDVLAWSQFVLLDVITIGTVLTLCESRPTRKQAIIGTLSVLATAAMISADNIAIIGAGYTVVLSCATYVLYRTFSTMSAKGKKILCAISGVAFIFFAASLVLNVLAGMHSSLWWQEALSMKQLLSNAGAASAQGDLRRYGFLFAGIGFVISLPLFLAKTRVSSFFATIIPVVLFINILRLKQITDTTLLDDGGFTEKIFLWFGAAVLFAVALKFIIKKGRVQLLSLSGLEHIGLTAFMVGAGPAGMIPALFHLGGQAVGHSGLWYATRDVDVLRSNTTIKWLTIALFASILAVPFSVTFVSELVGIGYSLQAHLALGLVAFAAMIVFTVSIVRAVIKLLAASSNVAEAVPTSKKHKILIVVLAVHVLVMFGVGGYLLTQQGIQFAVSVAQTISSL